MNILLRSFEQHSILWILISAVIGGFIGATCKFIFESIFSPLVQTRREAREAIRKYKYPFFQALTHLDRRIEFMLDFSNGQRKDLKSDEYYHLSTLYTFSNFFSWCNIVHDEAIFKYEPSSNNVRDFHILFYRVLKAVTSFKYFTYIDNFDEASIRKSTVPQLVLQAIGEQMLPRGMQVESSFPRPIGYVSFVKQYKSSDEFREWLVPLESFIQQTWDYGGIAWNRLVVLSANVRVFLAWLDSKKQYIGHREIKYFDSLNSDVAERVLKELRERGYERLLPQKRLPNKAN